MTAQFDVAARVTGRYDELLSHSYLDSTVDGLAGAMERDALLGTAWGGRAISSVLRPQFLGTATYERMRRAARLVTRGIVGACRRLLEDARLRKLCWVEPTAVRLMRVEERHRGPEVVGRLDGFLGSTGDYKIIEYSGTPGGLLYGDALVHAFAALPIMATLRRRHRLRPLATAEYVVQGYRRAHREWGGRGLPSIAAIVDEKFLRSDRYPEKRATIELLRSRGFNVHVVHSEQLAFRGRRLLAEGNPVDVVYYLDESVLEAIGEDAIIRALEQRAVWLVVGPRAGLWFNKAVFAILSDPTYSKLFEPDVARALNRHVPWTRLVRDSRTSHRGRTIDLLPFIADNRQSLVLKPALGAGGSGVVVGAGCDEQSWQATLKKALSIPHVVQELVELGGGDFPHLEDGTLRFTHYNAGLDPYVWNGRTVRGCLVRLSRTPLLNVAARGGSIVPVFLVDD